MSDYLESIEDFCGLSPFSEENAAELEAKRPGFIMKSVRSVSASIDSRLVTRGDVPFQRPYPEPVRQWVADLVTVRVFRALGRRPSDEQAEDIEKAAADALLEIKEAADPKDGLIRLPLHARTKQLQTTEPATLAYTEQSPFTSKHRQFDRVAGNRRYG